MASFLVILNGSAYGSELTFNGLRLADSLARKDDCEVRVFLLGDAVTCAKHGQKVPHGFYKVELMLHPILRHNGPVGVCGSCMDARGISDDELEAGCRRSSMDELAEWTMWADKVLVF